MHQPAAMGRIERRSHLAHEPGRPMRLEVARSCDRGAQVHAVHEPHRDVEDAVLLPRGVDRDDVRVLDQRGEARLAHEAVPEPLLVRQVGSDQLQRDRPPE